MNGVAPATLTEPLHKVDEAFVTDPCATFDGFERLGDELRSYCAEYYDETDFSKIAYKLPLTIMRRLSFDELCKAKFSTIYMMERTVDEQFRVDPQHAVVNKIENSMWRWGFWKAEWNEIVDAYDGVRDFSLDLEDFTITIDYTTGFNERGYSQFTRTFLDGVFAFLVHYKDEHVMTIGFSFADSRKILIQQVQLVKRRGNRFLFKFPKNRLEYVIDRFFVAFPAFRLYVADGEQIAKTSLRSYQQGLTREEKTLRDLVHSLKVRSGEEDFDRSRYKERRRYAEEHIQYYSEKIHHLRLDIPRLKEFYADIGRHGMGEKLHLNGHDHYLVVRSDK